jgi:hypothetical protein
LHSPVAGNSIGTLFVDIQARTAKLEADVGKVKGILGGIAGDTNALSQASSNMGATMSSSFTRAMPVMLLLRELFRGLFGDIGNVIKNIEDVPGISGETIASVETLRDNLAQIKVNLNAIAATGLGNLQNNITGIAGWLGNRAAQGNLAPGQKYDDDTAPPFEAGGRAMWDREAEERNPNQEKDEQTALAKIADLHQKITTVASDEATKINDLVALAQRYQTASESNSITTLESRNDIIKSLEAEYSAKEKMADLDKQLAEAEKAVRESSGKGQTSNLSLYERIKVLQARVAMLQYEISQDNRADPTHQNPTITEDAIAKNKELKSAQDNLNEATKKYGDLLTEVGTSISDDLVQGILHGEGMHNMFRKLIDDVVELIAKQVIEKPLASMFDTGLSAAGGAIMSFFADGGPYVANQPFIAGENGPELINPGGQSGSVVNAGDTGRMGGGGATQNISSTVNIGGGISRAELAGMIPQIVMQAKSGVMDGVRRGGAFRQVFAQGS